MDKLLQRLDELLAEERMHNERLQAEIQHLAVLSLAPARDALKGKVKA